MWTTCQTVRELLLPSLTNTEASIFAEEITITETESDFHFFPSNKTGIWYKLREGYKLHAEGLALKLQDIYTRWENMELPPSMYQAHVVLITKRG